MITLTNEKKKSNKIILLNKITLCYKNYFQKIVLIIELIVERIL